MRKLEVRVHRGESAERRAADERELRLGAQPDALLRERDQVRHDPSNELIGPAALFAVAPRGELVDPLRVAVIDRDDHRRYENDWRERRNDWRRDNERHYNDGRRGYSRRNPNAGESDQPGSAPNFDNGAGHQQ